MFTAMEAEAEEVEEESEMEDLLGERRQAMHAAYVPRFRGAVNEE